MENIFHQKQWKIFSIKNDGKYFPVENVSRKADEFSLKERNLVWCPVYKSGTSAWMTYLVHLSKQSPQEKDRLIAHNSGIGTALP